MLCGAALRRNITLIKKKTFLKEKNNDVANAAVRNGCRTLHAEEGKGKRREAN